MKKTVFAYLHTHWDREWYRNKEDFNIRLQNVVDIILDELISKRAPFFYFDGQTSAMEDYLKYNPDKTEIVKKLIKAQKLAIGPYYVSADSYLISFPMMLKNLDIGIEYSRNFLQTDFIGYMSDIFGISNSAFASLEMKNIDKAIIWRGVNPDFIYNNCNFRFKNINTLWLSMGYFNDFIHNNNIEGLNNYLDKIFKYTKNNCLLPIGADHLGILKNSSAIIRDINKKLNNYEIILTNPFEYFKNNDFKNTAKCSEFLDNKETYILQGVYGTRINQKIKNVEIENKLSKIVEPLNYHLNEKYTSHIEEIYKTLIKNYAHDTICGCSLDEVAKTADARFNKCNEALDSILNHLIFDFKTKNATNSKSQDTLGLFNLTNKNNLKVVKTELPYILKNAQVVGHYRCFPKSLLYDCYKIPVTEDICNVYTQYIQISNNKRYSFTPVHILKPNKKFNIKKNLIENSKIALKIQNEKIIIKNKKTNKNIQIKLTDVKDQGDSYNFAPFGNRKELIPIKTEILYDGEIQAALRIYFKDIKLDVFIDSYCKYIRFSAEINNKNKNHKLQLCIIGDKNIKQTIAQDAYGIIKRTHDPNYKIENHMPAKRPYEIKTNTYPMQNFVCANNFITLTKGLHEYEIYKKELRICMLRCTNTISNPKNPTRAVPAGPDLKIPNAQMIEKIKEDFAILFGNYKKAFSNIDIFMENYITVDGTFPKEKSILLGNINENEYFYGINQGNNIIYNYKKDK